MNRVFNFVSWLLSGTYLSSGPKNLQIAAHSAKLFKFLRGDGGTVFNEAVPENPATETPEERSRRLKRERDRRYKANKKARAAGAATPAFV